MSLYKLIENKAFTKVLDPQDIPLANSYMILVLEKRTIYSPGDERSRTNPGHGYPESTGHLSLIRSYITQDEKEWKKEISNAYEDKPGRTDFCAMITRKAVITSQTIVEIS